MGQVRHGSATTTHAVRASIQRSQVEGPPAIGPRAGLRARAAEPGTGHQSDDGREVAQARDGRGYEDRAVGTAFDGFDRSRGSRNRRVPASHAPTAGRLPLCPSAVYPAFDEVSVASLPATMSHGPPLVRGQWRMHLTATGCRGRQASAPEVQALPHRPSPLFLNQWRTMARST
jgi:hypothetical protein